MNTFFLALALVGGGIAVLQLLASLFGLGGHADADAAHVHLEDVGQGLNLFSVRALSAGVAFFGIVGGTLLNKLPLWGVIPLAAAAGLAAMVAVAAGMRAMLRLEHDPTVSIEQAIGTEGRVYLRIPAEKQGAGKVTITLGGRLVEYQAVTAQGALPTGTAVTVVDVFSPDTVEVVTSPTMKEILDGSTV